MSAMASWSLVLTLACGLSAATANAPAGRWAGRLSAALGVVCFVVILRGWEAWEYAVRRLVYGEGRTFGLTLDRAVEATLASALCAVVAGLTEIAETHENTRARRWILAVGALWGVAATAQLGWLARAT